MPKNPLTGKTDRHMLSPDYILKFRLGELEKERRAEEQEEKKGAEKERKAQVKKGKRRAHDSPDADEPETSRSVPSPLTALAGLEVLNLGSRTPSAANTPDNSPAIVSQPPLPERPAPTPSTSSKTRRPSKHSSSKLDFNHLVMPSHSASHQLFRLWCQPPPTFVRVRSGPRVLARIYPQQVMMEALPVRSRRWRGS